MTLTTSQTVTAITNCIAELQKDDKEFPKLANACQGSLNVYIDSTNVNIALSSWAIVDNGEYLYKARGTTPPSDTTSIDTTVAYNNNLNFSNPYQGLQAYYLINKMVTYSRIFDIASTSYNTATTFPVLIDYSQQLQAVNNAKTTVQTAITELLSTQTYYQTNLPTYLGTTIPTNLTSNFQIEYDLASTSYQIIQPVIQSWTTSLDTNSLNAFGTAIREMQYVNSGMFSPFMGGSFLDSEASFRCRETVGGIIDEATRHTDKLAVASEIYAASAALPMVLPADLANYNNNVTALNVLSLQAQQKIKALNNDADYSNITIALTSYENAIARFTQVMETITPWAMTVNKYSIAAVDWAAPYYSNIAYWKNEIARELYMESNWGGNFDYQGNSQMNVAYIKDRIQADQASAKILSDAANLCQTAMSNGLPTPQFNHALFLYTAANKAHDIAMTAIDDELSISNSMTYNNRMASYSQQLTALLPQITNPSAVYTDVQNIINDLNNFNTQYPGISDNDDDNDIDAYTDTTDVPEDQAHTATINTFRSSLTDDIVTLLLDLTSAMQAQNINFPNTVNIQLPTHFHYVYQINSNYTVISDPTLSKLQHILMQLQLDPLSTIPDSQLPVQNNDYIKLEYMDSSIPAYLDHSLPYINQTAAIKDQLITLLPQIHITPITDGILQILKNNASLVNTADLQDFNANFTADLSTLLTNVTTVMNQNVFNAQNASVVESTVPACPDMTAINNTLLSLEAQYLSLSNGLNNISSQLQNLVPSYNFGLCNLIEDLPHSALYTVAAITSAIAMYNKVAIGPVIAVALTGVVALEAAEQAFDTYFCHHN